MSIRSACFMAASLVACGAPRAARPPDAGPADARAAHQHYVDAINSNNLDSLLGMLTDDVVFLSANEPVMVGKAAVRPWVASYYQAYRTHWDKPVREFVVNGDWAFERYSYCRPIARGRTARSCAAPGGGYCSIITMPMANGAWRATRSARTIPRRPGDAAREDLVLQWLISVRGSAPTLPSALRGASDPRRCH